MRSDGSEKRQVTEGMLFGDAFPEWSPDGSKILLTVNENDVFVLKLIDLASGETTHLGEGAAPSWR
jgi:Tol biopolymer transport system component